MLCSIFCELNDGLILFLANIYTVDVNQEKNVAFFNIASEASFIITFRALFLSTGRPAILPAGPLLLDCHCWKKCGKIQNVGSSFDFKIFSSEIYALTKLHLTYRSFRAQIHLTF